VLEEGELEGEVDVEIEVDRVEDAELLAEIVAEAEGDVEGVKDGVKLADVDAVVVEDAVWVVEGAIEGGGGRDGECSI